MPREKILDSPLEIKSVKTKAIIRISFPSKRLSDTIFQALTPEINRIDTKRSSTTLAQHNSHLTLTIEALDTVALRAALNTYLRWISSISAVCSTLDSFSVNS